MRLELCDACLDRTETRLDRKALRRWQVFEAATEREHRCLSELTWKDIHPFDRHHGKQWAKRALRAAARRQGAFLPIGWDLDCNPCPDCFQVATDRKKTHVVSVWQRFEVARQREHRHLKHLTRDDLNEFAAWYREQDVKPSTVKHRILGLELCAGMREYVPRVNLDVDLDSGAIEFPTDLSKEERTACKYFCLFLDSMRMNKNVAVESIDDDLLDQFRCYLDRQPQLRREDTVDRIVLAVGRVVLRSGGELTCRNRLRARIPDETNDLGVQRWIEPFVAYLRETWSEPKKIPYYRMIATHYLGFAADYFEMATSHVRGPELFNGEMIEKWEASLLPTYRDPRYLPLAIRFFMYFCAGESDEVCNDELENAITLINSLLGVEDGRKRTPIPDDSTLRRLAREYCERRQELGWVKDPWNTLNQFVGWCHVRNKRTPDDLEVEDLQSYLDHLCTAYLDATDSGDGKVPSNSYGTYRNYITKNLDFWRWLRFRGLKRFDDLHWKKVRAHRIRPRRLTEDQVTRLVSVAKGLAESESGSRRVRAVRDLAMILLGILTGPRAIEVRNLRLQDVDLDHQRIRYFCMKSGERWIDLFEDQCIWLDEYLRLRPKSTRANDNYFFLAGNSAFARPLGEAGSLVIFRQLREAAGISSDLGNYHILRHTCATWFAAKIDVGDPDWTDFYALQRLLGHRDDKITSMYLHGDLITARDKMESSELARGLRRYGWVN